MAGEQGQQYPDYTEPTPERQAELRAVYNANVAKGRAPYESVHIRTREELWWVIREREWSLERFPSDPVSRPDLSSADLHGLDLSGIRLHGSQLRGTIFNNTNLSGAYLADADLGDANLSMSNLVGATLSDASLRNADLGKANLRGAFLIRTDLSNANLSLAKLTGADLVGAKLTGALLFGAHFDAETVLASVEMDATTRLADAVWDGVVLARMDWRRLPRLGDELLVTVAKSRSEKSGAYRVAARAYRGLSIALRSQGLLIPASTYRLREQVLERKALLVEGSLLGWAFSWLLFLVAGYGERPARSFAAYVLVLGGFAAAFFAATHGLLGFTPDASQVQPLQWYEALVLSVSSFHGRGFFQPLKSLGDPVAILAAAEAVSGLFIEITFIAAFTPRFFNWR